MTSNSKAQGKRIFPQLAGNTWTDVMALLTAVEKESGYGQIDALSQRLLEWIFVRSESGSLFIQTIVMTSEVASPATIYKSLAVLEREALISLTVDPNDQRRRIVKPTQKAQALFAQLSRELKAGLKRQGF
jgi:hypothetical protein